MDFSGAEKTGKYLKTPFLSRKSIYTHFPGAGEVFIYTYLESDIPEKYLYTPFLSDPVGPMHVKCKLTQSMFVLFFFSIFY